MSVSKRGAEGKDAMRRRLSQMQLPGFEGPDGAAREQAASEAALSTLSMILADPSECEVFESFLHSEYSVELLHLWKAIRKWDAQLDRQVMTAWSQNPGPEPPALAGEMRDARLVSQAVEIYDKFLDPGGDYFCASRVRFDAAEVAGLLERGVVRRGLFQGAKEAVANVLSAGLLRRYGAWMDTDNARRESKAIYDRRPSGGGLSESSDELYQLDDLGHRVRKGSNFSADSLNSPLPFEGGSPAGHACHARSFSLSGPSSGGNKPDKQDRRRSESSVVSGSSSNSNDNALRIVLTKPRRFSHQTSTSSDASGGSSPSTPTFERKGLSDAYDAGYLNQRRRSSQLSDVSDDPLAEEDGSDAPESPSPPEPSTPSAPVMRRAKEIDDVLDRAGGGGEKRERRSSDPEITAGEIRRRRSVSLEDLFGAAPVSASADDRPPANAPPARLEPLHGAPAAPDSPGASRRYSQTSEFSSEQTASVSRSSSLHNSELDCAHRGSLPAIDDDDHLKGPAFAPVPGDSPRRNSSTQETEAAA
ncbi:hypothetical protein JL720_4320 [Aureococcus anophagefferens]|nr:hypothetical protein JL720_4320 [Aureococcus anophagefferens]